MGEVVGEPVHFPGTEQRFARGYDEVVGEGQARLFFEHNLAHVGRIDRHPAKAGEPDFGAAVLRFGDDVALAQAVIAKLRVGDADAIDITRWQTSGTGEADVERIEVGAFAGKVAAFEHTADVANAAALGFGIALGVIDHPFVDCPRLVEIAGGATGDFECGSFDQSVGRQQGGRAGVEFFRCRIERGDLAGLGEVDGAVAGGKQAFDFEYRRGFAGWPAGRQHQGAVVRVALDANGSSVALPVVAQRFDPGGVFDRRQGNPDAGGAFGFGQFDAGGDFENAPTVFRRGIKSGLNGLRQTGAGKG